MENNEKNKIKNFRKNIKKINIKIDYFNCQSCLKNVDGYNDCLFLYNKIFKKIINNYEISDKWLGDFWIIGLIFFIKDFDYNKDERTLYIMIKKRLNNHKKKNYNKKKKKFPQLINFNINNF